MFAGAPQYLVSGLTQGAAYGLIGLGFTMIFNTTGIINFAQGEFVMLGGMLSVCLLGAGLRLPLAIVLACLATAVIGGLMERLAIRPIAGAPAINAVIITIGVSILLRGGAMLAFGKDTHALPAFSGTAPILALGAAIQPQSLWVLAVTLALLAALKLFFSATIQGKAMLACSCQKKAASLVGISVAREMGCETIAIASTGNGAASLSAYAAYCGMRCHVFIPVATPSGKLVQALYHGAEVTRVPGDYSASFRAARRNSDIPSDSSSRLICIETADCVRFR